MPTRDELIQMARDAATRYSLPPDLFARQIAHESAGWNVNAVSPQGARGLAQLMPATQKSLGVIDPFDPYQSLDAGAKLMRENMDRYGTWDMALMAYHGGTDPRNWGVKTQDYARRLGERAELGPERIQGAASPLYSLPEPAQMGTVEEEWEALFGAPLGDAPEAAPLDLIKLIDAPPEEYAQAMGEEVGEVENLIPLSERIAAGAIDFIADQLFEPMSVVALALAGPGAALGRKVAAGVGLKAFRSVASVTGGGELLMPASTGVRALRRLFAGAGMSLPFAVAETAESEEEQESRIEAFGVEMLVLTAFDAAFASVGAGIGRIGGRAARKRMQEATLASVGSVFTALRTAHPKLPAGEAQDLAAAMVLRQKIKTAESQFGAEAALKILNEADRLGQASPSDLMDMVERGAMDLFGDMEVNAAMARSGMGPETLAQTLKLMRDEVEMGAAGRMADAAAASARQLAAGKTFLYSGTVSYPFGKMTKDIPFMEAVARDLRVYEPGPRIWDSATRTWSHPKAGASRPITFDDLRNTKAYRDLPEAARADLDAYLSASIDLGAVEKEMLLGIETAGKRLYLDVLGAQRELELTTALEALEKEVKLLGGHRITKAREAIEKAVTDAEAYDNMAAALEAAGFRRDQTAKALKIVEEIRNGQAAAEASAEARALRNFIRQSLGLDAIEEGAEKGATKVSKREAKKAAAAEKRAARVAETGVSVEEPIVEETRQSTKTVTERLAALEGKTPPPATPPTASTTAPAASTTAPEAPPGPAKKKVGRPAKKKAPPAEKVAPAPLAEVPSPTIIPPASNVKIPKMPDVGHRGRLSNKELEQRRRIAAAAAQELGIAGLVEKLSRKKANTLDIIVAAVREKIGGEEKEVKDLVKALLEIYRDGK